jgi:hypothetical protein
VSATNVKVEPSERERLVERVADEWCDTCQNDGGWLNGAGGWTPCYNRLCAAVALNAYDKDHPNA